VIARHATLAAVLVAFAVTPSLTAQQVTDAQRRREAIQFYRAGQEFFVAEKFDRAADEFNKATLKDPLFTLAYYQAGQSYMNLRRYASAIQAFKGCIESTRSLYDLAQTNRFEVEKAREDQVREMRETIAQLQRSGHSLLAERAQQHLSDLQNQRTSLANGYRPPAEALLSLGSAYFRTGERDAAEAEWKAAAEVNPRLGEAHNNLAALYAQTGRYTEAAAAIKAAEKAGFRVNPQLKDEVEKGRKR
jgi:tetratricopeptide (TPR) repeat protein